MRLPPSSSGIRVAVGMPGSGKSYGVARDVERAASVFPVMVIDTCYDYGDASADLAAVGTSSVERAAALIEKGAQLAIVRPKGDPVTECARACAWALNYDGRAGVVFPEAHEHFPMHSKLPPPVQKVISAWRHFRVAAWFDSQRLAMLNTNITATASGSGELRLYAMYAPPDLDAAKKHGGQPLVSAVLSIYQDHFRHALECCTESCRACAPHRGYFVTSGPDPKVERDDA